MCESHRNIPVQLVGHEIPQDALACLSMPTTLAPVAANGRESVSALISPKKSVASGASSDVFGKVSEERDQVSASEVRGSVPAEADPERDVEKVLTPAPKKPKTNAQLAREGRGRATTVSNQQASANPVDVSKLLKEIRGTKKEKIRTGAKSKYRR